MESTRIQAPRERPIGVKIIVILLGLQGVFEVILGILALTNILPRGYLLTGSSPVGGALGGSFLLIGLAKLLLTWGLWTLKRWAWVVTLLFAGFNLMTSCFAVSQSRFVLWALVVDMIIPGVIWAYFILDENLRAAFRVCYPHASIHSASV